MSVPMPAPNETGVPVTTAVRQMAEGATNARGTLTLTAGATSTVWKDELAATGIAVFLSARSANAAATPPWLSAASNGQFTLTHASAPAGCVFDYLIQR